MTVILTNTNLSDLGLHRWLHLVGGVRPGQAQLVLHPQLGHHLIEAALRGEQATVRDGQHTS